MNIATGTIVRTVVLVVALFNQILVVLGKSPLPFDDAAVAEGVSMALTAAASLWAWWKNNSFTAAALAGDAVMRQIKSNPPAGDFESGDGA